MTELYSFEDWQEEQMRDSEFVEAKRDLELSYQVTRLRLLRDYTQEELAEKLDTHQSSISRLESGKSKPNLGFLERVVKALNGFVEINVYPDEEVSSSLSQTEEGAASREYPVRVPEWATNEELKVDDDAGEITEDRLVGVA